MSDQPTKPDRLRVLVTRIHALVAEAVRCLNDDKLFRVRAKLDAIEGYAIELDVALLDATQPAPPDDFRYVLSRAGKDPDCPACGHQLACPNCSRAESAPQEEWGLKVEGHKQWLRRGYQTDREAGVARAEIERAMEEDDERNIQIVLVSPIPLESGHEEKSK